METQSRRERERQARRDEIIAAAERVFGREGYESASMDEIAAEAQFTKRTIYQYFVNKEDLFYAVRLNERKHLFECLQTAIAGEGSGMEKIRRAAEAFHRFYLDNPEVFRQMNYAGKIVARAEAGPNQQELMRFGPYMFQELAKVIEAGMADGSIRGDLDTKMAAPAVAFVLTGFFRMLAEAGESFTRLLGLDQERFVDFALGLIGDALRAG